MMLSCVIGTSSLVLFSTLLFIGFAADAFLSTPRHQIRNSNLDVVAYSPIGQHQQRQSSSQLFSVRISQQQRRKTEEDAINIDDDDTCSSSNGSPFELFEERVKRRIDSCDETSKCIIDKIGNDGGDTAINNIVKLSTLSKSLNETDEEEFQTQRQEIIATLMNDNGGYLLIEIDTKDDANSLDRMWQCIEDVYKNNNAPGGDGPDSSSFLTQTLPRDDDNDDDEDDKDSSTTDKNNNGIISSEGGYQYIETNIRRNDGKLHVLKRNGIDDSMNDILTKPFHLLTSISKQVATIAVEKYACSDEEDLPDGPLYASKFINVVSDDGTDMGMPDEAPSSCTTHRLCQYYYAPIAPVQQEEEESKHPSISGSIRLDDDNNNDDEKKKKKKIFGIPALMTGLQKNKSNNRKGGKSADDSNNKYNSNSADADADADASDAVQRLCQSYFASVEIQGQQQQQEPSKCSSPGGSISWDDDHSNNDIMGKAVAHDDANNKDNSSQADVDADAASVEYLRSHTDWSLISIVPVASIVGLEVWNPKEQLWIRPELTARNHYLNKNNKNNTSKRRWHSNYVVCLSGKWLELIAKGGLQSAIHRVVDTTTTSSSTTRRLSAPFFFRPRQRIALDVQTEFGFGKDGREQLERSVSAKFKNNIASKFNEKDMKEATDTIGNFLIKSYHPLLF